MHGTIAAARGRAAGLSVMGKRPRKLSAASGGARGRGGGKGTCDKEMSDLMNCWGRNAFEDGKCGAHIDRLIRCMNKQARQGPPGQATVGFQLSQLDRKR